MRKAETEAQLFKLFLAVYKCYRLLYTVYGGKPMNLQISSSSMTPVYEQITAQIRRQIQDGTLKEGTQLPSVRAVARDYHISALTVKKAYDQLDSEGLVTTVHGKGSYVNAIDPQFSQEQARRQIEDTLSQTIAKARLMGMSSQEILEMVSLLLEEQT